MEPLHLVSNILPVLILTPHNTRADEAVIYEKILGAYWRVYMRFLWYSWTNRNFFEARKFCQGKGYGDLATLSVKEYRAINNIVQNASSGIEAKPFHVNRKVWLGVWRKAGTTTFVTVDYTPLENVHWTPGHPSPDLDDTKDYCMLCHITKAVGGPVRLMFVEADCKAKLGAVCKVNLSWNACDRDPCPDGQKCHPRGGPGYNCTGKRTPTTKYTELPTGFDVALFIFGLLIFLIVTVCLCCVWCCLRKCCRRAQGKNNTAPREEVRDEARETNAERMEEHEMQTTPTRQSKCRASSGQHPAQNIAQHPDQSNARPMEAAKATPMATPMSSPKSAPKAEPMATPMSSPKSAPKAEPIATPMSATN